MNGCQIRSVSRSPMHLVNSSLMSTLTVHCWWEDETVRERTSNPTSDQRKLTLHMQGRECSSSSSSSSSSYIKLLRQGGGGRGGYTPLRRCLENPGIKPPPPI